MLASLCFAAVVPFVPPTAPDLNFAPAADTSLTFTLRHRSSVSLEEGTMTMFGKEMPMDGAGMDHESKVSLKFTQAYGERAQHPVRTLTAFEHGVSAAMTEPGRDADVVEGALSSPLVGRPVRWVPSGDSKRPRPAFDSEQESGESDQALLQGLRYDLDAVGLLPPDGADLEKGWRAPAESLGDLLAMGGNLRSNFEREHLLETRGMGLMFEPAGFWPLDLALEGDVQLKLKGTRDKDGEQLAILDLNAEVRADGSSLDRHCLLNSNYTECEDKVCECHPDPVQADRELALEIEGTVVWNLTGNHLQGYVLKGDYSVHYTYAKSMLGGAEPEDLSILDARCKGEALWQLAVSPTPAE